MSDSWVDLSQPFDADAPHGPHPPPELEELHAVEEDGVNVQWYGAATHVGTHVDAPRHFVPDGDTIDDLSVSRYAGDGVVLDATRENPGPIDADALAEALDATDGAVRAGDVVLVRTGWGRRYGEDGYERYPWLTADAAEWILEKDPKLLGVDTRSPDRPRAMRPDDWDEYPVHRTLLPEGVLIAEHLRIPATLAGERCEVFGFPMNLRGGDGAPARFVARRP
jgi:kynurenine formamidase